MEERQMFDATCSECKQSCKVPFQPAADRPVFCLDCWKKKQEAKRGTRKF